MSYVTLPSVRVACSSHRPALTLARCSVAAHCASLRVLATPALRASDCAPPCADACAVFRVFAPLSPSAARCSGVADALWACPRASSRFAAFDCALRVLAPPAASRPPTASDRDGNAFLRFAPTLNSAWSFHCARKLACGSPCFIGLTTACFRHWRRPSCAPALRLRGVPCLRTSCARHFSPSGLHLFASVCSAKNARNDVHAVISD